jgi:SAM-dependent methyltransferase
MKRKIYTLSHNLAILKEIDNTGGQFTASEHSYATKKEFGETIYKTKENLLRHYLPVYLPLLSNLGFLIDSIRKNEYKNILSLGCGPSVLEHILKMLLPEESKLIACDFDAFIVEKVRKFFPELIVERFDFFKDDVKILQSKLNIEFDLVVFFASAYVMDDPGFIKLFSSLKKVGVKQVIDFHAGYLSTKDVIISYLKPLTTNPIVRKWFHKPPVTEKGYRGKFHGYERTRSELRRLYKNSGLELQKEISVSSFKYVAILGINRTTSFL